MPSIDRAKLVRIAVGFLVGAAVGAAGAHLILAQAELFSAADLIGLFVALLLAGSGLYTLFIGVNAATYRRLGSGVEPGEAPDADLLRFARRTGVVSVLAGLLFAAPPIVTILTPARGTLTAIYAAIAALIAIESWVNLKLWMDGDELVRAVVVRSAAICFWLLQGLFFLWAAAERMTLVDPIGSWPLLVVLMGTYLVVATTVSVRSGLAEH
ncbi:hypothetical protein GGR88_001095 [Sphingomonas jejuensis]|uniref:Uncharacterized protein n=1 Tax=Sphingomonas jejuensis TaxID=904715 RepID=A0ABX0XLN1_9SPHN|nr:hypothetical protein [Sphingomonas jejuensis]NJC33621.1 hypothetical protein [Sphingomonas jejuensis]